MRLVVCVADGAGDDDAAKWELVGNKRKSFDLPRQPRRLGLLDMLGTAAVQAARCVISGCLCVFSCCYLVLPELT